MMTGRTLIRQIVESCDTLDKEIPVQIVHRDTENCVITKDTCHAVFFINGKLSIEASQIRRCP